MQNFTIVGRKRVFQGFQSMDEVTVRFEGASESAPFEITRLVVERGDAVGVLVLHKETQSFQFVRQFRAALIQQGDPWPLEMAAGMIDGGESAEEAAIREVEEELGYRIERLVSLGDIFTVPGGFTEKLILYFAEVSDGNRTGAGGGTDDHEDIEIVSVAASEAKKLIYEGTLRDAKTIVAIFKAIDLGLVQTEG